MASAQPKHTLKIAPAVVIAYDIKKKKKREEKVRSLVDEEAVADH